VVEEIARAKGLNAVLIHDDAEGTDLRRTDWMLVARNPGVLAQQGIRQAAREVAPVPGLRAWTDDSNNLLQILK
jgi:hypothetical protein